MRRPLQIAIAGLVGGWLAAASAFHSGGVGNCGGCHVMHDTSQGQQATEGLLLSANPTDLCLRCHESDFGNTWGADVVNPGPMYGGGAFVFLTAENLNDAPGGSDPANYIPGHRAGHNVISDVLGTTADPEFTVSPGGSYPSSNLHCTSCHDPHGKAGHYRLLYGSDHPEARVNGQLFQYTTPAPDAAGIDVEGPAESETNHAAYRSGMTDWCGNCHGAYHSESSGSAFEHPVGESLGGEADNYNRYRGTGYMDGDGQTAYIATVPVETPDATTGFRGPVASSSQVTCMSCHRAHASSAPRSGRWDFNITTWAEEGVLSGTYEIPNPYETTAGDAQRRLCEKCHGADVPD